MSPRLNPLRSPADDLKTPARYDDWTAAEKQSWLWSNLILGDPHEPTALPPLRMPFQARPYAELRTVLDRDELDKALSRSSDLMEPGRPKVIHALGSVATVELVVDHDSPFTGLLGPPLSGGAIGLLRMSLVTRVSERSSYTPGFGLKFLIDAKPSADVLAMNHTVGQGRDHDLFSNSMTNDLSNEHEELPLPNRIMSVLFHRVSRRPRRLTSTHLANRHADGSAVESPRSPDRLVFHPTTDARSIFRGRAGVDFRRVLADADDGISLYAVHGLVDGVASPIGELRTTSRFVSSDGGDRLFFRHMQDEDDRVLGFVRN